MTQDAIDMVQWLAVWVGQSRELIEQLLWGGLLGGLLCATIHLLTMLATRWGDRGPTSKSLIFSILVHVSCAFGLVAVAPPEFNPEPPKREQQIQIRQLFVEGEEEQQLDDTGNTPVWEKLPDSPDQQLTRIERSPLAFEPVEGPPRRPEKLTMVELEFPVLPSLPEQPEAKPQRQEQADSGLRIESAAPLKIDDPTAQAQPELQRPSMSVIRRGIQRNGLKQTPIERAPNRGAVDRIRKDFDPSRQLASIPSPLDPNAFLKRGDQPNKSRRRSGPAPAIVPVDEAGTTAEKSTQGTSSGSAGPPQFTRNRTRTSPSRKDGGMQRFRPDRTPRIPVATPDRVVGVRQGLKIDLPTDGFKPNVRRPNFEPIRTRKTASIPATYRLRSLARRKEIARKYGGTDASERAVETSLRWLVLHQSVEGYWDADGFSAQCPQGNLCRGRGGRQLHGTENTPKEQRWAGLKADTGLTALAVLAFLGAGYTHEEGQYADHIDRALSWLIRQQREDGFLGGQATHYARMYCHAMATYAMAEAYGMQSDPTTDTRIREPLARAIAYIVENQNPRDGGWRYQNWMQSDMSMFGWQLMALKSAEIAGIPIPSETKNKMIQFLKDRSLGKSNGLAAYRIAQPSLPASASMTAESLFCKQMLGMKRTNPASGEAIAYLKMRLPRRSEQNLYYWYYGTLALYQYGGQPWRQWNEALRDVLVEDQRKTGHAAGSWDPKPPWGPFGGRIYSTALSTLCLEVYYRFLPLYQMGGRYGEE